MSNSIIPTIAPFVVIISIFIFITILQKLSGKKKKTEKKLGIIDYVMMLCFLSVFLGLLFTIVGIFLPESTGMRGINFTDHRQFKANAKSIGILLFVIGVLPIALYYIRHGDEPKSVTKKCPFCANDIKNEAIVCQFCGKDIPPEHSM